MLSASVRRGFPSQQFRLNRLGGNTSVLNDHLQVQTADIAEPIMFDQALRFRTGSSWYYALDLEDAAFAEVAEGGATGFIQATGKHNNLTIEAGS